MSASLGHVSSSVHGQPRPQACVPRTCDSGVCVSPGRVPSGVRVSPQARCWDVSPQMSMGNHVPKRVSPGHVTQVSVCPHKHVTRTYVLGCPCVPTSTSPEHMSLGVCVSPQARHWDICPQVSMCPPPPHTHVPRTSVPRCPCVPACPTPIPIRTTGERVALGGGRTPPKTPRRVAPGDTMCQKRAGLTPKCDSCPELGHPKTPSRSPPRGSGRR